MRCFPRSVSGPGGGQPKWEGPFLYEYLPVGPFILVPSARYTRVCVCVYRYVVYSYVFVYLTDKAGTMKGFTGMCLTDLPIFLSFPSFFFLSLFLFFPGPFPPLPFCRDLGTVGGAAHRSAAGLIFSHMEPRPDRRRDLPHILYSVPFSSFSPPPSPLWE